MEIWRKVVVYSRKGVSEDDFAHYEVSNEGRVRLGEAVYSAGTNNDGYKFVGLWDRVKRKQKWFLVHRLVAFAFIGRPPKGLPEVHHIDHDRGNNVLSNLEFSSRRKNLDESSKHRASKKGPDFDAGYHAVMKLGVGKSLKEIQGMAVAARLLERRGTWEKKQGVGPYLELNKGDPA